MTLAHASTFYSAVNRSRWCCVILVLQRRQSQQVVLCHPSAAPLSFYKDELPQDTAKGSPPPHMTLTPLPLPHNKAIITHNGWYYVVLVLPLMFNAKTTQLPSL